MDDMVELRCKNCGAPLDAKDVQSDAKFVTCQYCGTSQQRIDAKAYMDQMMGEIKSWMSKAMPMGYAGASMDNVDPIARYNIYMTNVKPMVEPEIREFRLDMNSLISSPLIVLPFNKGDPLRAKRSSKQAFEFNAKLKSIEALAMDQENKPKIAEAESISAAYALIANNSKLLTDTTPGRFALMANNFTEAANNMSKCQGYEPFVKRLNALVEVCFASDYVLNGNAVDCIVKAERGVNALEEAKKELFKSPTMAVMIRAVDVEISQSKTLLHIAEMAQQTSSDPLNLLNILNEVSSLKYPKNHKWDYLLDKKERDVEMFSWIESIMDARSSGTLPVCAGDGNLLYPFWDVDLKYSFTTGALFSKKSVEVTEDLLIPATFTVSETALSNPRTGLTDIFAAAPEASILTKIKGQENSISGGAGIGTLADSAANNSPGTRKIVIPLSTKTEATKLVEEYLKQCSSSHSKLKLSKPLVKKLVYIPCNLNGDSISLPKAFGNLTPKVVSALGAKGIVII
ncbi:MAG: zinc ribbon domain-containing protein [Candidatus Methanomethylophilaceae archaeon]|nr:zinc ribbon domain-containing protein [Candidatus Methanomethylophilaceae archaeon]